MNGIEKITGRIEQDAAAEIEAIRSEAEAKAAAIRAAGEEKAAALEKSGHAKNLELAEKRRERLISAAEMERRQKLLAIKQSCVSDAFGLALTRLSNLADEEYIEALAKWVALESETGHEELVFAEATREKMGEQVVRRANALKPGADFRLADETRVMRGVILKDGKVEINGSLETRFHILRESMASDVAGILFPQ